MHLARPVDDLGRADHIAQAPTRHGVGLGERAAAERALGHARQAREVDVLVGGVDDVLVDLVGDDPQVVLLGHAGDELEFGAGKDVAGGVRRVAEDERLRAGQRAGGLELGLVEGELGGMQLDVGGLGAAEDRVGTVVLVERGEDDDAVAGVRDGHDRAHHGLGGAAGDHDLRLGVDVEAHARRLLGGERGAEIGRAPGNGVLVGPGVGDLGKPVEDGARRVEVGEALREVDGVVLHANARHPAYHGVREARSVPAEFLHCSLLGGRRQSARSILPRRGTGPAAARALAPSCYAPLATRAAPAGRCRTVGSLVQPAK